MATLQFKGKSAVWNHHLSVPYHTLEKDTKKSLKGTDAEENLIIEGDNLLALKSLLPKYQGRIKCIYIDPPYNTGNEGWAYNDNVNSPTMREWIGKEVGKDDLTRHDKWLCMMTPRLKLLRELLSDDGAIFVSIDDNEQHHLRNIMDGIFGEENFVTNVIWEKKYSPQSDARWLSDNHDFVIVYAKNKNEWKPHLLPRTESSDAVYKNPDNDPRGPWMSDNPSAKTYSATTDFPIKSPSGKFFYPHKSRCWRFTKERFKELIKDNRIWFGKDGNGMPRLKTFLSEVQAGLVSKTIWFRDEVGDNQEAKRILKDLFPNEHTDLFETPKPTRLIKRILQLATDKDSIVLDSFAGSATTAHATLDLNKEDGGNRRFVILEMENYANNITAERVRRASKKFGYKTGFTYYTLGSSIDAESILTGKLPTYKEFAKYVYYLATGKNHPDEKKIKEEDSFVGKTDHQSVYLIYEKNVDALKKLAITLDWAQKTHKKDSNKKIVYAPACYLDDEALEQYNIKFVSIPYNLFERST